MNETVTIARSEDAARCLENDEGEAVGPGGPGGGETGRAGSHDDDVNL